MFAETITQLNLAISNCEGVPIQEVSSIIGQRYKQNKEVFLAEIFKDSLIHEFPVLLKKNMSTKVSELKIIHYKVLNLLFDAIDIDKQNLYLDYLSLSWSEIATTEHLNYYLLVEHLINPHTIAHGKTQLDLSYWDKSLNKEVIVPKGMKITKAWKHIVSDKKLLADVQTAYSQISNEDTFKGTLCLSIHPLDYLTVSLNHNCWSSCYSIESDSCYRAAPLTLLNSTNTIVAYLKSDKDEYYSEIGQEWNNKKWRMLITIDPDFEILALGTPYPYDAADLQSISVEKLNTLINKDLSLINSEENSNFDITMTLPEHIFNDSDCGPYSIAAEKDYKPLIKKYNLSIDGSLCVVCGKEYDDLSSEWRCKYCRDQ